MNVCMCVRHAVHKYGHCKHDRSSFFIYVCICIVTLYIWIKSVTEKITRKIVQGFLNISGSTICWKTSKITRKKNYRKLSCNIFERVSAMFTEQKKNRDGQKIFCF